ncbi:uncharacterized protein DS421_14g472920 [Arachis hypogaea]|nr:uncharacterized protein DS421_14g472920 [Arachis hypogaea]
MQRTENGRTEKNLEERRGYPENREEQSWSRQGKADGRTKDGGTERRCDYDPKRRSYDQRLDALVVAAEDTQLQCQLPAPVPAAGRQ